MDLSYTAIAKMIDHALLAPALSQDELERGCGLARRYDVASVCILPYYVKAASELLANSAVVASTTIGFPHGGQSTRVKVTEAQQALDDGARELDMVVNISRVKSHDYGPVETEIREILEVSRARGRKLKVIFENCFLDEAEKLALCGICGTVGVDWVKTSTGFGTGGATDADLVLMRRHCPATVQLKASGGIRSFARVLEVQALGATRVGTSATARILEECRASLGLPPLSSASDVSGGY